MTPVRSRCPGRQASGIRSSLRRRWKRWSARRAKPSRRSRTRNRLFFRSRARRRPISEMWAWAPVKPSASKINGETMRKLFGILTLVLVPVAGYAAENGLQWAYPVEPPPGNNADAAPPSRPVNQALIATTYTGLPRMPEAVAKGKPLPCMQCHLANGGSHPESAAISGLSVNYIIEQVHAFRDGERVDVRTGRMVLASKAISEKELKEAAEYYAAIGPERQQWIKTVVSNEVPKGPAPFGDGGFRYHAAGGGTEPLPQGMVIEMAEDDDLVRARDQINGGFVQYARA